MAHIDALVDKITDVALRDALRDEVNTLLHKQSFGLVFQEHKPETVELPNYLVKRGCKVRIKREVDGALWRVERVTAGGADLLALDDGSAKRQEPIDALVVVREFGEAIYPGLRSIDRIERGGDKPCHAVINAENYHALETLLYAYEGQVDAIYIDPPYNTGAKDWKYNNDYVDGVDQYRHSKWLAFMERRLQLAKRLLDPESSVLVVTIDENEVHHLGVLLEQIFPASVRQMVTIAINGKGVSKAGKLSSVEEYAFFVFVGSAAAAPGADNLFNEVNDSVDETAAMEDPWASLLRRGTDAGRSDRPGMFYPFLIDPGAKRVKAIGEAIEPGTPRASVVVPEGLVAVWPLRTDGSEGRWQVGRAGAEKLLSDGFLKLGAHNRRRDQWAIKYLFKAQRDRIDAGTLVVAGRGDDGSAILTESAAKEVAAKTIWNRSRHNAGSYGSGLLRTLIPGHAFPFPKSLYAVVDTLRVMVGARPDALVLDFFGGSGTTAHALAYLNAEDGGRRRSIVVTNNEVSLEEARALRGRGLQPGDDEWERLGIFEFVTRPRLTAAITGETGNAVPLEGKYLNGQPLRDGFDENIEFFALTYEDPDLIELGKKFEAIAPLLWLKAGGSGERVEAREGSWTLPADGRYGVLFDTDDWREFIDATKARRDVSHVFIVSDSESVFQQIASELPTAVASTRLYDDYIRTFQINTRGRS